MKVQHYGHIIDSEVPVTGVFNIHSLEFIYDEETINLDFEEHRRTCRKRYHDDCYEADGSQTELIGFKKLKGGKDRGKWAPDPKAEFSAILHEGTLQVVKSKWFVRGALCSPCYPGQVDGETQGRYLAYAPPPDVVSSDETNTLRRWIFPANSQWWKKFTKKMSVCTSR